MVEFCAISKSYAGIPVLKEVSFRLEAGRTLGLAGENGAGKSTLMNILGGNCSADSGSIRFHGSLYAPRHSHDASHHGVAFIHQELNLFSNLSIAENLYLTSFPRCRWLPLIHRAKMMARAKTLLNQVGLGMSPNTLVEKLSPGEQQLVEIAKALAVDARLILFDEPTTSLTSRETARLFSLMDQLRARGLTIIYISHNLEDILRLCDDIAVLRDGELVGNGPKQEFTINRLISLMVGRTLSQIFPARSQTSTQAPLLRVKELTEPGMVANISFTLHRGEILGISGLMGSGRSELARILFGLDPFARGHIWLEEEPFSPGPRENLKRGLAFLTENRREEGLCLEASVAENLTLASLAQHASQLAGWLDRARLRAAAEQIRQAVRLTPTVRTGQPVKQLSGGNQQKVVLAKWLLTKPKVFILDEPTRGIDVGAKYEIYQLINELADQGAGVLMISSELEELIGLCDRILVMRRGEIKDTLKKPEFERARILRAALGEGRE